MESKNLITAIALLISVSVAAFSQQADPESDFEVSLIDDGNVVKIINYLGDKSDVRIPSQIQGLPVTAIGENAFRGKELTSVVIPDSVTIIEYHAFMETQLTSITIPDSVTLIGHGAFQDNQLTGVSIGNSVTEIGYEAFAGNRLTGVTIPDSVTVIGKLAFSGNQLTSVSISNSVTTIGQEAFDVNDEITVSPDNPNFCSIDGVLYNKNGTRLIRWPKSKPVNIPAGVTKIVDFAFQDCQLTGVSIGNSVTTIWGRAFLRNYKMTAITVSSGNPNFSSIDGVLYNKDGTRLIHWPAAKPVNIPTGVTVIGEYAFCIEEKWSSESNPVSVIIPDGVTKIERCAFFMRKLTGVTIPDSVTEIGGRAFSDNQLSSVVIPDSVTEIGYEAFSNNPLTSITIGANVALYIESGLHTSFPNGFDLFYYANDKQAGTYVYRNDAWTRQ